MDVDAQRRQVVEARENVTAPAIAAHTQREDVRVLEQEQHVVQVILLALLDERPLKCQALRVRDDAELTDVQPSRHVRGRQACVGSQFSSLRLMCDMNSSATAPSINRWS